MVECCSIDKCDQREHQRAHADISSQSGTIGQQQDGDIGLKDTEADPVQVETFVRELCKFASALIFEGPLGAAPSKPCKDILSSLVQPLSLIPVIRIDVVQTGPLRALGLVFWQIEWIRGRAATVVRVPGLGSERSS